MEYLGTQIMVVPNVKRLGLSTPWLGEKSHQFDILSSST
jgi:hypothetical protein